MSAMFNIVHNCSTFSAIRLRFPLLNALQSGQCSLTTGTTRRYLSHCLQFYMQHSDTYVQISPPSSCCRFPARGFPCLLTQATGGGQRWACGRGRDSTFGCFSNTPTEGAALVASVATGLQPQVPHEQLHCLKHLCRCLFG